MSNDVRGELDWIVMKCLDKDRNRRYDTASGLAKDVESYLNDDPVRACPPSAWYRFRKFARRNKRPLATLGLLGLMLLATLATTAGTVGWAVRDQAAQQAEKDREVEEALRDAARERDQRNWVKAREAAKQVAWLLAGGGREPE